MKNLFQISTVPLKNHIRSPFRKEKITTEVLENQSNIA